MNKANRASPRSWSLSGEKGEEGRFGVLLKAGVGGANSVLCKTALGEFHGHFRSGLSGFLSHSYKCRDVKAWLLGCISFDFLSSRNATVFVSVVVAVSINVIFCDFIFS